MVWIGLDRLYEIWDCLLLPSNRIILSNHITHVDKILLSTISRCVGVWLCSALLLSEDVLVEAILLAGLTSICKRVSVCGAHPFLLLHTNGHSSMKNLAC